MSQDSYTRAMNCFWDSTGDTLEQVGPGNPLPVTGSLGPVTGLTVTGSDATPVTVPAATSTLIIAAADSFCY